MNDFDKMRDNVGNRFDLVLIAAERVRELHRERKLQEEYMRQDRVNVREYFAQRKNKEVPTLQAFNEIESSEVGREYLEKIRERHARARAKRKDRNV